MKPKSIILIIAGSDSSGGAGIQADIKTVTALGSYAMTAITAVTIQNTTGVKSIIPIDPKEISNQIEFTSQDIRPDAIKIGMLHSSQVIKSVIRSLDLIKVNKVVLDPVMIAKGGAWLMRVAHNSVIDHVRKQRPQQANLDHYAEVEDQVGKESDANQFDQQHFKSQLQNAIKSLEDPFRSIVIMRDIQGMSYEEIQGSLELSASQVKVYLHRARRKLRENSKLRQLFEEQIADKSEAKQPIALVANTDKGSGHAQ